ncbi:MAG: squalene synthase HpnD [Betaproteobacteria bacterium]|nr:squalene synthase HpnD [Betaproteobacteria bacterium]
MSPDEYCQQKASQSGSSFYYSFLFLPPPRRRAITAFYAFCREVDDVVDECTDLNVARTKLAWWRSEVAAIYAGNAKHPVALALAALLPEFNIAQERLQEIIDGMEMDLTQHRYRDFEALQKYCHLVAGVVGLVSAEIFGYSNPRTLEYAENLGMAFQLTNIIRDVGEDARRDRIYIPIDELARFNVTAADILHARHSEAFEKLMVFQINRALDYYARAMTLLPAEDRRAQRPGLVMAAIYRTLLEEIRRDGCHVLTQRTALTPVRKLWIAWRTWMRG